MNTIIKIIVVIAMLGLFPMSSWSAETEVSEGSTSTDSGTSIQMQRLQKHRHLKSDRLHFKGLSEKPAFQGSKVPPEFEPSGGQVTQTPSPYKEGVFHRIMAYPATCPADPGSTVVVWTVTDQAPWNSVPPNNGSYDIGIADDNNDGNFDSVSQLMPSVTQILSRAQLSPVAVYVYQERYDKGIQKIPSFVNDLIYAITKNTFTTSHALMPCGNAYSNPNAPDVYYEFNFTGPTPGFVYTLRIIRNFDYNTNQCNLERIVLERMEGGLEKELQIYVGSPYMSGISIPTLLQLDEDGHL